MKTRYLQNIAFTTIAILGFGFPEKDYAQVPGQNTANFPNASAGNYISIPDNSTLDITSAITVEAWINISSATGGGAIVCKGSGGGGEVFCLDLGGNDLGSPGTARFYCWVGGTAYVATNTATINANTWYHLAGVKSGTTLYLYVNGTAGTGVTCPANLTTNNHIISIGSRQSASSSYDLWVQGKIDEVRIWNSGRTQAQIQSDMYRELVTYPTSGLVAYYQFNGSSGQYNDLSGNSNNGSVVGTVTNIASTAPIPFYTIAAGSWTTTGTWASGQGVPPSANYTDVWINHNVPLNAAKTLRDVTIASSAVFSDAGFQLTSAGTLDLISGIFKLGAGTATVWPAFSINNISEGTTVEYAATVAQNVSSVPAYSNLTFSGASTKTATGNLSIDRSLTISSGTFAGGTGLAHDVGVNWTNNGAFTAGTSTVNMTGSNAASIQGTATTTFYNLIISKDASAVVTNSTLPLSVTNNLTVNTGQLTCSYSEGWSTIGNDFTVNGGSIFNHNVAWNGSNGLQVGGNLIIDGTYSRSGYYPLILMFGAGTKNLKGTNLGYLTLNDGDYYANGAIGCDQNFWAMFGSTTGSFHTNGQTVTATAGLFIYGGAVYLDGGILNVTGGGINIGYAAKNGAMTISSGTATCDYFNVGNGTLIGTVTHSGGTLNITGNMVINGSCTYTCTDSPFINISGNWTINGTYSGATETITFNGNSTQSIPIETYYNLAFSGSGNKNFAAAITVTNNLSIASGTLANLGTFTSSANTMTFGGAGVINGSWGSSGSAATYKNNTYFTVTSGMINVATGSCSNPSVAVTSQINVSCYGGNDGRITLNTTGGTPPYHFSLDNGITWYPLLTETGIPGPHEFTDLNATDTYELRVMDSNGCMSPEIP